MESILKESFWNHFWNTTAIENTVGKVNGNKSNLEFVLEKLKKKN